MLASIILGLLVGFIICIPIGPLNLLVMKTKLNWGTTNSITMALAGSIMDGLYLFIILSGLTFLTPSPLLENLIHWFGIGIIFYLGIKDTFLKEKKSVKFDLSETNIEHLKIPFTTKTWSSRGIISFIMGIFIYISNPTIILTMTALGAFLKGLDLFQLTFLNRLFFSVSVGMGSFIWFNLLIYLIHRYQEPLKERYFKVFSKVSGILLIIFSVILIVEKINFFHN
jgi:threonine/homoserine/homoserine lactone efflux protein